MCSVILHIVILHVTIYSHKEVMATEIEKKKNFRILSLFWPTGLIVDHKMGLNAFFVCVLPCAFGL